MAVTGVPFIVTLQAPELSPEDRLVVRIWSPEGQELEAITLTGPDPVEATELQIGRAGRTALRFTWPEGEVRYPLRVIPGILSILPPVLAIVLALLLREVIISLFLGVLVGAVFVFDYDLLQGFLRTADHYLLGQLTEPSHMAIALFTLLLGSMVGVMTKAGGTHGIVEQISRVARTARTGQLATWLMGLVIFFDDYTNTLIVGPTMRPITDRLRISREKLSYIVDSTAAPVASIALISGWIGYEVGLIRDAFENLGIDQDAYFTFVQTLPYSFYPIFALVLGFTVAITQHEIGPMGPAESRARRTGKVLRDGATPLADFESAAVAPPDGIPHRWINGVLPILTVLLGTLSGIYLGGRSTLVAERVEEFGLREIFSAGDSILALLWGSLAGTIVAIGLALSQRLLSLRQAMDAWVSGARSMLLAVVILSLAWSIGAVAEELQTAPYVVAKLEGVVTATLLPALTFVVAALVAFGTGTSWGTMAILMPLVIPLAINLIPDAFTGASSSPLVLGAISAVLGGAVWGDHCSPISDTTVMSSLASGADHIDHVRTQLPYALLAGGVTIFIGYLPIALGLPVWASLLLGVGATVALFQFLGKSPD